MSDPRRQQILVAANAIEVPPSSSVPASEAARITVAANLAHYGYGLSAQAFTALGGLGEAELAAWWADVELVLAEATGAEKKMEAFVVYKNFPSEVLAMSEVEYWSRQLCMYWGLPNELFAQPAQERPPRTDERAGELTFRVLHLADEKTLPAIRDGLFAKPTRWLEGQWHDVQFLVGALDEQVDLGALPFVENRIQLAAHLLERGARVSVASATDVLRLAAALSGGDVSLREPTRLRKLTRRERRGLLALLERCPNLEEDLARRREPWKRLLQQLHPGDYRDQVPRVVAAYDKLYNAAPIATFNSELERLLAARDRDALTLLQTRPGEFARRLRMTLARFGPEAVTAFTRVLGELTVHQLLKLRGFLATIDERRWRTFPPRGNWSKVQIVDRATNEKVGEPKALADRLGEVVSGVIEAVTGRARRGAPAAGGAPTPRPRTETALQLRSATADVLGALDDELSRRLREVGPVALAPETARVKLPTNDDKLSPFGRGTVFPIPPNIQFVRTATYWKSGPTSHNLWYDNGWNFHDAEWAPLGVCAWNRERFHDAAVFSGDPTNSKDLEGRACQMLDLYLDKLVKRGVRYAVWTVLCYSRKTFADAEEVHAALQWGVEPERGKLFEPSRCQLSFPLRGDSLTKYVVYLDLARRELVYLDASLPARVTSAAANGKLLSRNLPAYLEYLASLPSVHDLFLHAPQDPRGMPVLYDDAQRALAHGQPAYVFRPTNPDSEFTPFDPTRLLG